MNHTKESQTIEAYKIVLKDLKKTKKCKDYAMGCVICSLWRMIDDLTDYYKFVVTENSWKKKK